MEASPTPSGARRRVRSWAQTVKWGTPFAGDCIDRSTGEQTTLTARSGNSIPDYNLGLSTTLRLEGRHLYALFTRSAGFDIYNQPLQWGVFKR